MNKEVGRPRITLADLNPQWRDIMHAIYNGGGSDAEVKVALAIAPARALSNKVWDDLQESEPEFMQAVSEGRLMAEMWWARAGQKGIMMGKDFNATVYIFNMKNRFRSWKDKQEHALTGADGGPVRTEAAVQIYLPANGRDKPIDGKEIKPQASGKKTKG